MLARFTKMHGLGNDFVLLDLVSQNVRMTADFISRIADRHTGIGFDQLLVARPPTRPDLDFACTIYNADGSEAEQCGNGMRCFARFVRDRGLTTADEMHIETSNRTVTCYVDGDDITVDMAPPELNPVNIPFSADQQAVLYPLDVPDAGRHCIASISMGNPHAVLTVDNVDTAPVSELGPVIEHHERFPNRANVGFMQIMSKDHIRLRVFERGVGETSACGTGACAAVVGGILQGLLDHSVTVTLPGGDLTVQWQGGDAPVLMSGPATRVYEGRVHI
ncbi:MAG: diaminopimelate epimerase [Pseudomonadota bacterium]